jgi:O-antigen ligase
MRTTVYDPQARLLQQQRLRSGGLNFTEVMVLVVLGWAYMFAVSAPLFGFQLQVSTIKHFPLMLLMPSLVLHFVGGRINRSPVPAGAVWGITWPLVLMAIFVVVGSLVARLELKVPETFLTLGLYLLLLPLFAATPNHSQHAASWAKWLSALWIVTALVALVGQAARYTQEGLLHEIEYVVVGAFFLLFYLARAAWLKLLALVLMVAAVAVNHKLTGFLLLAMAFLYIGLDWGWRRLDRRWRGFYVVAAIVMAALFVAGLALAFFEFRQLLPTGNPEVRLKQYENAWRQFLDSPIWGSAYLEGSGEVFMQNARALNIPTHSDVLDMLKHGGLIAFGLFVWGYWKIFRIVSRAIAATLGDHLLHAYFVGVRFFQIGALVTFSLNPILLKGPFLIVIWGNLGLAVGLAIGVLARERTAMPAPVASKVSLHGKAVARPGMAPLGPK